MRINPGRVLAGLGRKAKEYYNNPERLKELLTSANLIIRDNEQLSDLIDDIGKLISLVRDYVKKEYTMVSKGTIITVIAGLIYLVNPVDIVPDFLFGGFLDDAAVIGYIVSRLRGEIEKYNDWKKIQ
ncbi:YkvA family protein [Gudongella sp. SC589]|uniref:YkvA family protein n=1 Tax=Gudongella sp. SC589 TaxID=3385990 RepID=UPI003904C993